MEPRPGRPDADRKMMEEIPQEPIAADPDEGDEPDDEAEEDDPEDAGELEDERR